jgi:hypothetical protein
LKKNIIFVAERKNRSNEISRDIGISPILIKGGTVTVGCQFDPAPIE